MINMRTRLALVASFVAVALMAACGGSDSSEDNGFQANLTDPASVPTMERPGDPTLFRIAPDGSISTDGASVAAPGQTPEGPRQGANYTVQSGDTCASIAAAFEITDEELRGANPLINDDCSNLQPEQTLRIPAGTEETPTAVATTPAVTPTPEPTTATEPTPAPTPTTAPQPTPTPARQTYVLQSGDFCGSVARDFGVSLADFMAVNGFSEGDCTRLDVGDVVIIP